MDVTKQIYRAVVTALGLFALGVQYILGASDGAMLLVWTVNYFSFFTILTNAIASLALLLPLAAPGSRPGRYFARPAVRTAVAGYIIIVAAVYFLILRHTWDPQGWQLIADRMLHYLMPALFVIDWLLFMPKGVVPWKSVLAALLLPLVYIVWTLLHGAATGWYPYPFLDVPRLGYAAVLTNIAGLFLVFFSVGLALVTIDRLLGRIRSGADAEPTHSR